MKTFDYICLKCGARIPIEYNLDCTFTKPLDCPACKEHIPFDRVTDIVYNFLHPQELNPTQETYIERNIHDQPRADTTI